MLGIDPGILRVADEFLSKAIAAEAPQPKSKILAPEKPTILVVDDEQIIADTTAELLNTFGFGPFALQRANGAADCRRTQARLFAR
jgi:hypothetical protein